MRRTPFKRKSKNPISKLQKEADTLLQQVIKLLTPHCEVCGKPTQVGHHVYPKSVSNRLRYDLDNIARICNGCHMRHHQAGDPRIHATIIRKRGGDKWFINLTKKKDEYIKVDRFYYLEVINKLKDKLNALLKS